MFAFTNTTEAANYWGRPLVQEQVVADLAGALFNLLDEQGEEVDDRVFLMRDGTVEILTDDQEAQEEALGKSSHARYLHRRQRFLDQAPTCPRLKHSAWWIAHNCVAHIAIGLVPCRSTFWLHDWTSRRLNRLST
ncbi:MAG: hypothetical protein JKY65_07100 [Planctomycetes bacterium]|nr:hypothetical protein [Planctomycetota bacterium]